MKRSFRRHVGKRERDFDRLERMTRSVEGDITKNKSSQIRRALRRSCFGCLGVRNTGSKAFRAEGTERIMGVSWSRGSHTKKDA